MNEADADGAARREITLGGTPFSYTVPPRLREVGVRIATLEPAPQATDWEAVARTEAFASANYEGARVTRLATAGLLEPPRLRPRSRGEWMIANVYDALVAARDDACLPLSFAKILWLHGIVGRNAMDDPADAGAFRRSDDIVVGNALTGEVIYRPPPAALVPRLVDDLCAWHNDADEEPFVKAVLLHYFTGWIHPFADGNGRTARVLFAWSCARHAGLAGIWHLSLSSVIAQDWRPYNKGYRLSQQSGNVTPFLERQAMYLERALALAEWRP